MDVKSAPDYLAMSKEINAAKEIVRQREEYNHSLEEVHKKSTNGRKRLYAMIQVANKSLEKLHRELETHKSTSEGLQKEVDKVTKVSNQIKKQLRYYMESDINSFSNSIQRTLNKWAQSYMETSPKDSINITKQAITREPVLTILHKSKSGSESSSDTRTGVKKQVSFLDRLKNKQQAKSASSGDRASFPSSRVSFENRKSGILKNSKTALESKSPKKTKKKDRGLEQATSPILHDITKPTVSSLLKCRSKSPQSMPRKSLSSSNSSRTNQSPRVTIPVTQERKRKSPKDKPSITNPPEQTTTGNKANSKVSSMLGKQIKNNQSKQEDAFHDSIALNFQIPKNILASLVEHKTAIIEDENITVKLAKSPANSPRKTSNISSSKENNLNGKKSKENNFMSGMRAGDDLCHGVKSEDCGEDRIELTLPQILKSQQSFTFPKTTNSNASIHSDSETEIEMPCELDGKISNSSVKFGDRYSVVFDRVISMFDTV